MPAAGQKLQPRLPQSPKPNAAELAAVEFGIERKLPAIFQYAEKKASRSPEERVAAYNAEKAEFEKALLKWPEFFRDQLRATLEASRFIDWAHMAPDIMETFRSRGRLSVLDRGLQFLYNSSGSKTDPEFKNMREVNRFLRETDLPPSVERLFAVHSRAMKGQVEGLARRLLGTVRDFAVVGVETEKGITDLEFKRVNANPYLSFEEEGVARNGRRFGYIRYPDPVAIKKEVLQRIEKTAPEVFQAISEFQAKDPGYQEAARDSESAQYKKLTRALITALLDERYDSFQEEIEKYKGLATVEEVLNYIKCVALHHRDIISIHPLGDGNGRTTRYECLYAPLDKVGISRPRLNDPNADILFSPSGWVREVQRGILSTDELYRDMTRRVNLGLRVENSPELLFPNVVRDVGIELRFRGKKRTERNITLQSIDPAQFGAFVDTIFKIEPNLARTFKNAPVETMADIRERFKTFAKQNVVLCHVPKKGIEQVGLQLVDFDVRSVFGVPLSGDKERWENKISRWHSKTLIWRGMCDTQNEVDTQDALKLFSQLGWISLSNNLAGVAGKSPNAVRKAVQGEFDRYNEDLVTGKLYEMVIDHVEAKANYDQSYGLSTSRKWGIASGFAWGRGVFGYNNDEVAEHQDEIKARLVVGAYQAHKDVDVRRFKILDDRFSYKFGRQEEIMAIGGLDPDAIMVVQLLNAKRQIERSFVRNSKDPSEIWEIEGGFHPDSAELDKLPANQVLKKHRI